MKIFVYSMATSKEFAALDFDTVQSKKCILKPSPITVGHSRKCTLKPSLIIIGHWIP